ncbi:MAG: ECF transporter S component [Hornefia sp.]|nr:ECF transporter S component [Hornefia sp.]
MGRNFDLSQYRAAARKRTRVSAILIFLVIPFSMLALGKLLGSNMYLVGSFLIVAYTLIPFIMVFENRKPKAREVVLIAMMSALTVVVHMFFHLTLPLQAGTAMVIVSGISLGPEEGFLVGALSRFVCNFYMGQGPWTPWQMFCWGLLGFLAGLAFNKIDYEEAKKKGFREELGSRSFKLIIGPVMCILFALIAAYLSYMLFPGDDKTFFGWRLYAFGIAGLVFGVLVQRKKLTVDGITMALFTFFVTFIIYGGIMNVCAMVMSAAIPGGKPVSLNALRLLYITGAPYDAQHAGSAAIFVFLFGNKFIKKVERIKIKYGIYK